MTPQQKQLTDAYQQLSPELRRLSASFFRFNDQDGEDSIQQLWIDLATTNITDEIKDLKQYIKCCLFYRCLNRQTNRRREGQKANHYYRYLLVIMPTEYQAEEVDKDRLELIAKFTEQLSPRQQAVFSLLLQGKSTKEIAEIQGNTYNTIKHNKRLIVKKLKKYFADNGEEFEYDKVSRTI